MDKVRYISVILPLKLEWEPCYRTTEDVRPGSRVRVKFAGKTYSAVVSKTDVTPDIAPEKVRDIESVELGMENILFAEIELWRKVADYYLCTVGEVYKAAYPAGKINMEQARAKSKRKAKAETVEQSLNAAKEGIIAYNLPDLVDKVKLSDAQEKAYAQISEGFKAGKPVLLHGVTGSGKTEIYIKLAQRTLRRGLNVLYLVPEIALSRQLEDRLNEHFGERLTVFHSGESPASRRNSAETIRKGRYIALCTRSGIFLPHHDLGLIIVDEEHDSSYKQDSPAPRYNGRDTALMMSTLHKDCNIILGSATPSLEEIYNTNAGRHIKVRLIERFHGADDAGIEIIDTRAERRKNGMSGNFSRKLIDRIRDNLQKGEQTLILRSRRAWSSALQCGECGDLIKCPRCNVSMSYHKTEGVMLCHYCGHKETYMGTCPKCGGVLTYLGAGTQKIEEEAAALFPGARIARLDSDTAQNKRLESRIIKDFAKGETDILIGTQIITKGFDFSNLSLVAIIAADTMLGVQDFRADEKALHLMEQFRGRCGRRAGKGLLVIQTSQPEHPVYNQLILNGMTSDHSLMMERKDFGFPPFSRIIELTVKDTYEDRAERISAVLADRLEQLFAQGSWKEVPPVTRPYKPAVDRVADQHIRKIRICLKKDRTLTDRKMAMKELITAFEKEKKYDGHIVIDVDPS